MDLTRRLQPLSFFAADLRLNISNEQITIFYIPFHRYYF